jgi:hypothetical protein
VVKEPNITETIRLINSLRWFGHVQRMEENRIPKRELYMNLQTRLGGRPRNRWGRVEEYLVGKGGRIVYITERNGRSFWERQGIVAFCTYQWNEWIDWFIHSFMDWLISTDKQLCQQLRCFNIKIWDGVRI